MCAPSATDALQDLNPAADLHAVVLAADRGVAPMPWAGQFMQA